MSTRRRPWAPDIPLLIELYAKLGAVETARLLNRTVFSTRVQANRLGLRLSRETNSHLHREGYLRGAGYRAALPTPQEIDARAAEIRAAWPPERLGIYQNVDPWEQEPSIRTFRVRMG